MTTQQHIGNAKQAGVLDLGKMRGVSDDSLGPFFGRIAVSTGLVPRVGDTRDCSSNVCHPASLSTVLKSAGPPSYFDHVARCIDLVR